MTTRSVVLLAVMLSACNDPSSDNNDGGTGTESAATSTSSGGVPGSGGATVGDTSADETGDEGQCPVPDGSFAVWEALADPDHLTSAVSMLATDDGGLVVASFERILHYDAEGDPSAVHSAGEHIRGLASLDGDRYVALLDTDDALQLSTYAFGGELDSTSTSFNSGVVGYDMPLVFDGDVTVVTMQHGDDETAGILQIRDGTLSPVHEFEVPWTLDSWATQSEDHVFVASLTNRGMTVTAYDGGSEFWSKTIPTIGEDAWQYPSGLTVADGVLLVHSGSSELPLRALDPEEGSELWNSALAPAVVSTSPCGDVFALVAGEDEDELYRIAGDGPVLATTLARATIPHSGTAAILAMALGADGRVYVARGLTADPPAGSVVNLKAY